MTEGARRLGLTAKQVAAIAELPLSAITVDPGKVFAPGWQDRRADVL